MFYAYTAYTDNSGKSAPTAITKCMKSIFLNDCKIMTNP